MTYREWTTKQSYFYLAFFILISYCIFFLANSIYPFGKGTLAISDLYACYIPQLCELKRCILGGGSLLHTWNRIDGSTPLGMANLGILFQLGNIFFLLIPDNFIPKFLSIYIPFKTVLVGFSMLLLLNNLDRNKSDNYNKVIISITYALCPFTATYFFLIIWTDQLIYLPLLTLYLTKWIQDKKYTKHFLILLTLDFLSNFYMAYMTVLFLFLYFNLILLQKTNFKTKLQSNLKYISIHLIALLISLPVLYASFKPLLANTTTFDVGSFFKNIFEFNLFKIVLKLTTPYYDSIINSDISPFIFIGVSGLLLITLYRKTENYNRRLFFLWLFTLASTFISPLYGLWHAFEAPSGFPCRFSYIFFFLTCLIFYHTLSSTSLNSPIETQLSEPQSTEYQPNEQLIMHIHSKVKSSRLSLVGLLVFTLISISWFVVCMLEFNAKVLFVIASPFVFLLMSLFIIESNFKYIKFILFIEFYLSFIFFSSTTYLSLCSTNTSAIAKSDNSLKTQLGEYKSDKLGRVAIQDTTLSPNLSIQYKFPNITAFNNIRNSKTMKTLNTFNSLLLDSNAIPVTDLTPVQKLLLNVEYQYKDGKLEKSQLPTALGYVIPNSIPQLEMTEDMDFADFQNFVCNQILKTKEKMFIRQSASDVKKTLEQVSYIYNLDNSKKYYLTLPYKESTRGLTGDLIELNGESYFRRRDELFIKEIDEQLKELTFTIKSPAANTFVEEIPALYYLNEPLLEKFQETLLANKFTLTYSDDLTIDGEVDSSTDGILYLSIPYDTYTVYVDGKEVPYIESLPGFLGISVKKGKHDIHIKYKYF